MPIKERGWGVLISKEQRLQKFPYNCQKPEYFPEFFKNVAICYTAVSSAKQSKKKVVYTMKYTLHDTKAI